MSFNAIYTDKYGNEKLISLPWYAAFAPSSRKAKVKKICGNCGGKGVETCRQCDGKGKEADKGGHEKTGAQHFSAHDKEDYSKADNKKIIQMKQDDKSWKEILNAINKQSQSQLKEHYKKNLQDKVDQPDNTGGNGSSNYPQEEYSKRNDKTIIQMKNAGKEWEEILGAIHKQSVSQLQAHYKANLQERAEQASGGVGGGPQSVGKDDIDRMSEKAAKRYWQQRCTEHYDSTGERLTPEEMRDRDNE